MKNSVNSIITVISTIQDILNRSGWAGVIDVEDVRFDPRWGEMEFSCGGTDYRLSMDEEGEVLQCHTSSAREPGYCWTEWERA